MSQTLYPLLFEPAYMDHLWGGGRIPEAFGRPSRLGTSAESWEVSDRPEAISVIANGCLRGRNLRDAIERYGVGLLGPSSRPDVFPLLVKIIDAGQRLSVQVHPGDHSPAIPGAEPKTEMWYVLQTFPGAAVFAGLMPGIVRSHVEDALRQGNFEHILQRIPVQPRDAIYIPGGRIHAIDAGSIILEVQQNSNTTYRLYDWGRLDPQGKPRTLHIREAMSVTDWTDRGTPVVPPRLIRQTKAGAHWAIASSPHFVVERIDIETEYAIAQDGHSFHVLFPHTGDIVLAGGFAEQHVPRGRSVLLPAAAGEYRVIPPAKPVSVLLIRRP